MKKNEKCEAFQNTISCSIQYKYSELAKMVVHISTKPESKCMKERNMTQWAFRKYNNKETAYVETFSKAYSIRYTHTHANIYTLFI